MNNTLVSQGKKFPFQVSVVAWGDLLGYGGKIAEAGFNPLDERAKSSISRMRRFHRIVAEHSNRKFPSLVINDGVAVFRDLSLRSRSIGYDFLERSWDLFQSINTEEQKYGDPGIRLVVACGFRIRGRKAVVEHKHSKVNSIIKRFKAGSLIAEQAIREASTSRPSFDIVPQLQANFAFTKAYTAESSGANGGLPGKNFYLDMSLLEGHSPKWPIGSEQIEWRHEGLGLDAVFLKVEELPKLKLAGTELKEVRSGLQVAQSLAGDLHVLDALRRSSKLSTTLS